MTGAEPEVISSAIALSVANARNRLLKTVQLLNTVQHWS